MTPPRANYWHKEENGQNQTVYCELCPQNCKILPGKSGRCGTRTNRGGELTIPNYGRFCSLALDPIEKKPLYHFYPGSAILSIGTVGCNLSCRFCQNWQISHPNEPPFSGHAAENPPLAEISPEKLADLAVEKKAPSVAFTYNEPSIWAEFLLDAAAACRERGIRTVAVTNGMIQGEARRDLYAKIDAANIDLKAFSPEFYRELCGGSLAAVQETIRYAAKETGIWLELTTLLIPGRNDSDDEIRRLADWVAETAGAETPLHFSAFFPTYRLTDLPRTPSETLFRARRIAQSAGIKYVYCGNIADSESQATRCPTCGERLIIRSGYRTASTLADGKCPKCGEKIAGCFV